MVIRNRWLALALLVGAFALGLLFANGLLGRARDIPDLRRSASLAEALDTTFTAPAPEEMNPDAVRRASELGAAFPSIADRITPAVVRIRAERGVSRPQRTLFRSQNEEEPRLEVAGGTGFIVSSDGFILTNNHVVQGADALLVILSNKREYDGVIVGTDPTTDIALVKIDVDDVPAAPLGDSDAARVGEWVLAFGNPGIGSSSLDFTVTSGIISAKGRPLSILRASLQDDAGFAIEDFLQTDAVINPGNSGGPLINLRGEVVGINTAISSSTGRYEGYGFAIPINLARRVMRDLVEHGRVRRALLGINVQEVTPEDAEVYGLPDIRGVVVSQLSEDSPADAAGVRPHDVIIGIEGRPVERVGELQRLVAQNRPGDEVRIDLIRYGEPLSVFVKLTEAPSVAAEPSTTNGNGLGRRRGAEALGLRIGDATAEEADQFGYPRRSAIVEEVIGFGPADRRGVFVGMRIVSIDGAAVATAREATANLRRVTSGDIASLELEAPGGILRIANLRMP
ncbi:MAG: trypsin-like peptidase domain-containing protein [Gemmatimonadota bacterium]